MHMMMRHGSRGLIAGLIAISGLLVVIGLAVAAASGGSSNDDDNGFAPGEPTPGSSPNLTATASANATSQAPLLEPTPHATATSPAPSATLPPDGSVSSPPLPPYVPPTQTPIPTPVSGTTTLPLSDLPALPAGTQRVDAPIDELEMLVLESFPPQYMLHVEAGLPSGCAKAAGYEAARSGNTVTVSVYNSLPTAALACTAIYGMYEVNINLGSDYVSGQTYTVRVNDKSVTFTAQ